jgi:hypothetical protein
MYSHGSASAGSRLRTSVLTPTSPMPRREANAPPDPRPDHQRRRGVTPARRPV